MILILTWLLLGLLLGGVSYFLIPWSLAFLGGVELRDKVGRYFIKQMMTVIGDVALVAREQGGLSLNGVSFDPSFGADKVTVAGQKGHVADDLGLKSRLAGKPFGLALESHPVYISPLFAEFAEKASDALHSNRLGMQPDGGVRLDFEVPQPSIVPNIRGAHRILDGDARRYYSTLAESWAQKSQEKFGKRVSMGQTLLLIAAFSVGVGMALVAFKYGPGGTGGGTTIPISVAGAPLLASVGNSDRLRMGGAVLAVVAVVGVMAVAAGMGWGLVAAIVFVVGFVVGAGLLPGMVLLLRDGVPAGGLLGIGFAIAAQIAFGKAALVRRDDGTYEWTVLRSDGDDYYSLLKDGQRVEIDAGRGDLFAFGFGELAVVEQKSDRNMGKWTVVDTPGASETPVEQRAGVPVSPPRREQRGDSWLVSLANIQRAIRGSASSTLIRRGRDKALDERGGTNQLSQLWTMGFATALLFGGFIMGSIVFML